MGMVTLHGAPITREVFVGTRAPVGCLLAYNSVFFFLPVYHRKRVLYCASVTFVRGRERERETPVTSFDITLKSRVIMHMITSTARRPNAAVDPF